MTAEPSDRSLLPWSHRLGVVGRVLVTLGSGALAALVGTFAHRMGAASNIPYGLALAFLLLGLSTWCARSRCGVAGVGWHLIASSATAWLIAMGMIGSGALTPVGFGGDMPYVTEHAGYIWLYGLILLQCAFLLLPRAWFTMTPRTPVRPRSATDATAADDTATGAGIMDVDDAGAADADGMMLAVALANDTNDATATADADRMER